jgi:hypothetical protein
MVASLYRCVLCRHPLFSWASPARFSSCLRHSKGTLQVHFDPQYSMPGKAQVDRAMLKRFSLTDITRFGTAIAPDEKFMMVTFRSKEDALAAENAAPSLLRAELQQHAGYSIRAQAMSAAQGQDEVKAAAARRKGKRDRAAAAQQPQPPPHHAPAQALPPGVGSPGFPGPMAPQPMWPHAAPVMYMPHPGAPPPLMASAQMMGAAPPQAPPRPAGFLHSIGAQPAWQASPQQAEHAPAGAGVELGPASGVGGDDIADGVARAALDVPGRSSAGAVESGSTGLPGLGVDLAGLLSRAQGTGGAAGAPQSDAEAHNMLSLLKQLGSSAPGDS